MKLPKLIWTEREAAPNMFHTIALKLQPKSTTRAFNSRFL